jgi:hypothetical protein
VPLHDARRRSYVDHLLNLYRSIPGVLGHVRKADRTLAKQLHDQGVPLYAVGNAFILAAARRVRHNAFSSPLPPIRSLHYFLPVIREVLDRPPGPRQIDELRRELGIGPPPL